MSLDTNLKLKIRIFLNCKNCTLGQSSIFLIKYLNRINEKIKLNKRLKLHHEIDEALAIFTSIFTKASH